jgi:hypothetical protein
MTVSELIDRLRDLEGEGLGECEVRLAFQPNWPLQFEIGGVTEPPMDAEAEGLPVVYIAEGSSITESPYAPRWAFGGAE